MAERALPVTTISSHAGGGTWIPERMISTSSPLLRRVTSGMMRPLILAPTQVSPMLVWTAYAKSIGVAPRGSAMSCPFGVKQNT
ncbi:hypothetical protein D9M72_620210 [compost metagenome]